MEIYFLDYHEAFNDQHKIIATLNNTAKSASAWAQNYLTKIVKGEKHPSLATWEAFRQAFLTNFGDTLKWEKAITSIGQLTQTKSTQAYTTQFHTLAEELSWAEETLIDIYKKGLKPDVLRHLLLMGMGGQTKNFSLEDWMNYAIQTDEINFASRTRDNKDNTNRGERKRYTEQGKAGNFPNTPRNSDNKNWVPKEVISKRIKEGQCIKCGKNRHHIGECRSKEYLQDPVQGREASVKGEEEDKSESMVSEN